MARNQSSSSRQRQPKPKGSLRLWAGRLFKTGLFAGLLGLMILGIFVMVARGEIDSFEGLKASPNGQMIRIRASDGTVIQSLGPSFGRWLTINTPSALRAPFMCGPLAAISRRAGQP
jgi:hypothetical protein